MQITLAVVAGPHKGQEYTFARHDTFLVGRSRHAHFQLPAKDKYFSRIHFMIEVNPPQCRLVDMGSHNGTYVNGDRIYAADLLNGDQIRAGHTVLKLSVHPEGSDAEMPTAASLGDSQAAPKRLSKLDPVPEIPGYILDRAIGKGNMGIVYRAKRKSDGLDVAVKIVVPATKGTPKQLERFLREARSLRELIHPHIVRFRDLGEHGGMLYFVNDLIAGIDARKLVKKVGPLSLRRAVRLASHLLLAIEYAHTKGVVHRDIKPANLLVARKKGKEYGFLADYGLARVYQDSQLSGLTMFNDFAEAAGFMPPEQLTNYRDAQPTADQYAVAATLYYLLTGEYVYDLPKQIHRQFSVILQQQPIPIQNRRPDIPQEIAAVIHKALSRNPAQRFADAAAFRQALVHAVKKDAG